MRAKYKDKRYNPMHCKHPDILLLRSSAVFARNVVCRGLFDFTRAVNKIQSVNITYYDKYLGAKYIDHVLTKRAQKVITERYYTA